MSQLMGNIRRNSTAAGGASAEIYNLDFPRLLEQHKGAIARALPNHLSVERIMRVALTAFRKNDSLAKCQPISVLAAVVQASQLGLELHQNGEAFLVPYEDECQLIPGYKGLMKLVRNSGLVRDIFAHEVRINDFFDYDLGAARRLVHKPMAGEGNFPAPDSSRGKVVGYYAVALLCDGTPTFVMKHQLDVDAIRDATRGYLSAKRRGRATPWDTHPVAMGKKTLIRLLCNSQLPMSAELQVALQLDKADLMGVKQGIKLEQAADGSYEPPSFDNLPPVDGEDGDAGARPPAQSRPAPQQSNWRGTQRTEPEREPTARAPQPPAQPPQRTAAPAKPAAAPRAPAPQPAQAPAPATSATQRPPQGAVPPQQQDRPKSRVEQELEADLAKMRNCREMIDLDEIVIRLESRYSGAALEMINRTYDDLRLQLNPKRRDLFEAG